MHSFHSMKTNSNLHPLCSFKLYSDVKSNLSESVIRLSKQNEMNIKLNKYPFDETLSHQNRENHMTKMNCVYISY